jgi:cytochrome c
MSRIVRLTLLALLVSPGSVQSQNVDRGRAFAQAHCARCHAIGHTGRSPFRPAPPFRTLHQRYPIETLEESLAEGIVTGHPAMPEFRLAPNEIADFIAFLKSLER